MQTVLLTILGIIVFLVAAVAIGGLYIATKLARGGTRLTRKKVEDAKTLVNHAEVSDAARELHAQAVTKAAAIPDTHFWNVRAVFRAIAETVETLVKAAQQAHADRKAVADGKITSARSYLTTVASAVQKEFGCDARLEPSEILLGDADQFVANRNYDEAAVKVKEAQDAADAEYSRIRAEKSGAPAALPAPDDKPASE